MPCFLDTIISISATSVLRFGNFPASGKETPQQVSMKWTQVHKNGLSAICTLPVSCKYSQNKRKEEEEEEEEEKSL